jgi:hypothetical protein
MILVEREYASPLVSVDTTAREKNAGPGFESFVDSPARSLRPFTMFMLHALSNTHLNINLRVSALENLFLFIQRSSTTEGYLQNTMSHRELNELFGVLSHFDSCATLIRIYIPKTT